MKLLTAIYAALAALVIIFTSAAFAQSVEVKQINAQMLQTTVKDIAGDASGSGTVLYSKADDKGKIKTYILTNYHVVSDAYQTTTEWDEKESKEVKKRVQMPVTVLTYNYVDTSRYVSETSRRVKILKSDSLRDLALLEVLDDTVTMPTSKIATSRVDMGETVWAVGSGKGHPTFITQGILGYNHELIEGYAFTMTSSAVSPGNSGGGLYRKNGNGDYELIGVPSRVRRDAAHTAFVIPIDDVKEFLRSGYKQILGE